MPIPKKAAEMMGTIQWVLLADQANQNNEIGKQKAPTMDMGSRASGATLCPVSWYFFSK